MPARLSWNELHRIPLGFTGYPPDSPFLNRELTANLEFESKKLEKENVICSGQSLLFC